MGALLQIRPEKAALIEGESEREIAADEVELGDFLRVRPGERIPADGAVVEGMSTVDESLLTGEAEPQAKAPGDGVTGGSLNGAGVLVIETERVGRDAVLTWHQALRCSMDTHEVWRSHLSSPSLSWIR